MDKKYQNLKLSELSGFDFKVRYRNPTFYKVLADELIHNDFQYKVGLNVDTVKFNPSGLGEKGGLYFTNIHNLMAL